MAEESPQKAEKSGWRISYIFVILFSIVVDQISKWFVSEMIMRPAQSKGDPVMLWDWFLDAPDKLSYSEFAITPFYNIVLVWNYGVSFGLFNNQSDENALLLSVVAIIIAFFLILWMLDTGSRAVGMALALAVGGALGNVIDRLRFGAVIDYIDLHYAGHHWPAFNVADMCVVLGISIVIVHALFFEKKPS